MKEAQEYINKLAEAVEMQISDEVSKSALDKIVQEDLFERHVLNNRSFRFQQYYFKTICNKDYYLRKEHFFREFKAKYSLQYVDNDFIDKLESQKIDLLKLVEDDALVELYFKTFKYAQLRKKEKFITSEQGSFFTKFVHTFKPDDYCALDNPIKGYFSLNKEGFFQAFLAVSMAYRNWSMKRQDLINQIK